MEERTRFLAEGTMEVGPKEDCFVFLDGEHLGRLLVRHFGIDTEPGSYDRVGRVRVTVERLED